MKLGTGACAPLISSFVSKVNVPNGVIVFSTVLNVGVIFPSLACAEGKNVPENSSADVARIPVSNLLFS